MTQSNLLKTTLIESTDSVLVLVDVQAVFADKLPPAEREPLLNRIGWIVDVATRLNIPVITMGEDIGSNGGLIKSIKAKLPNDQIVHNKMVFGLSAEQSILKSVNQTGKNHVIMAGFETDVCVAQSAVGLLSYRFHVAVLADGCGSPGMGHENGLRRMAQAGVLITDIKSVYYEWVRTVVADDEFKSEFIAEIGNPDGIIL
ncbi:MAG: isochorismatase family protein [Anaerolineae bacterium]